MLVAYAVSNLLFTGNFPQDHTLNHAELKY